MKGKNHIIAGTTTGTVTAFFTFSGSILGAGVTVAASALASIIPDIDLPKSKAGSKLKPIAKIINKLFGHRTITHAPLWLVPLFLIYFKLPDLTSDLSLFLRTQISCLLVGYISGFISHLLSDMLTKGGIPLFYPFKRHRYSLIPVASGKYDIVLIIITTILYVLFYIFINNI